MAVLDRKYSLAFWSDKKRTIGVLIAMIGIFLVWDILGIGLKIFYQGESSYVLPFEILPELPVEELFFLFLLSYLTILLYRYGETRA